MGRWTITNTVSGVEIGSFEADSRKAALDAMARDQGYDSYAEQLDAIESDGSDLRVEAVDEG
jgi:hypothetical protein